jgi:2-phosphosulfolactate phosphatase
LPPRRLEAKTAFFLAPWRPGGKKSLSLNMKKIDVCLSPDLMHLYDVHDRSVVVVDILRATSCIVTAFANGAESITPFAHLEDCKRMKAKGYITSGERNGEKLEGFDKGNSPFEYSDGSVKGKKIAFTTTNGTKAIEKSKYARELIIGSFLNLTTAVNHLQASDYNILVVCAGWKGKVNLEDTLFAGAVMENLKDQVEPECDAPLAAQHLYNLAKADPVKFLSNSTHVKRLNKLNIHKDIAYCLTTDMFWVLPILKNGVLMC